MSRSRVDFLDLPNEILIMILNKLDNVHILYSLFGIKNERLNSIIEDESFSNTLNFSSVVDNSKILDRFCNFILPRFYFNVKCLIVEPILLERILLTTHYPNLTHLKLLNFQRDNSLNYLTDHSFLEYISKKSIKRLDLVNEDCELGIGSLTIYTKQVYARILTCFQTLEYFNVIQKPISLYPSLSIRSLPSNTFPSLTLTYLSIRVVTFTDCLYLLDGRLEQLNTCILQIQDMETDTSIVHNMDDLPNLKCFSLIHYGLIQVYDSKIGFLLRRMLNLEKLTMYLRLDSQSVFIDPVNIINEFTMYLSKLYSLKFYLSAINNTNDLVQYLSNNNIKRNDIKIRYEEISTTVCSAGNTSTYQIFTLPFQFIALMSLSNVFPNIKFNNVIELWVHDVIPFEHKFFLRIAQAFPFLKKFYISDFSPLSCYANKLSDNIQSYQIVEYPHVTVLDLTRARNNYIEQFLNQNKTRLPSLSQLNIFYEQLRIITEDFTREATRRNCANVTRLNTGREIVGSKEYHIYFPLL